MELVNVTSLTDLKKGDTLIVNGGALKNEVIKVKKIKVSESDGVEVIYDLKLNKFFNLGMFLEGKSWVKELKILR